MDKRDSQKMAIQTSVGRLKGIHSPSEQDKIRLLTRMRKQFIKDRTRVENRIKSLLYHGGLISCTEDRPISEPLLREYETLETPKYLGFPKAFNFLLAFFKHTIRRDPKRHKGTILSESNPMIICEKSYVGKT